MSNWIYVFIGGGIGSLVRFGIANYLISPNAKFPYATFVANIVACFILGILVSIQLKEQLQNHHALLLMTGFCGGFSTFSTFSMEALNLMQNQQVGLAFIYIGLSVLFGLLFVYFGFKIHQHF